MLRKISAIFIMLVCSSLCLGQQTPFNNQSAKQWAEIALDQLPNQIKAIDEPAMRIFLRSRLAKFLWTSRVSSQMDPSKRAEVLVKEALADLEASEADLPVHYANIFRNDLLALLQLHAPDVARRLKEQYESEQKEPNGQLQIAYSMINQKSGLGPAVDLVRQSIGNGQDPGPTLLFFINRLQQDKPTEVPKLLTAILANIEQSPKSISLESLFLLKVFYIENPVQLDLRARYITLAISFIERTQSLEDEEQLLQAYRLMREILPLSRELAPSIYQRANQLFAALSSRLPKITSDRLAAEARIEQSTDPLNQLIIEANATTDESLRDDLLTQAAQLALNKKQIKMAADLAIRTSSEGEHGLWRDQFLGNVITQALKEKDSILAEEVVLKINSVSNRSASLQKIALYLFDAKDLAHARELLNSAFKLVQSEDTSAQKAKLLLNLTTTFLKIDELRALEAAQAAIKVINAIPAPRPEDKPDSATHKQYVQGLLQIAWNIVPTFHQLSPKDYLGANTVINGILNKEIKACALLGASTGILDTSQDKASKAPAN